MRMILKLRHITCVALASFLFLPPLGARGESGDGLQTRIDRRNHRIMEEIMLRSNVPGMSAAIGKDGKVVWAEGIQPVVRSA